MSESIIELQLVKEKQSRLGKRQYYYEQHKSFSDISNWHN